jgi:hypothetical protein
VDGAVPAVLAVAWPGGIEDGETRTEAVAGAWGFKTGWISEGNAAFAPRTTLVGASAAARFGDGNSSALGSASVSAAASVPDGSADGSTMPPAGGSVVGAGSMLG